MVHESITIQGINSGDVAAIWAEVLPVLMPAFHAGEFNEYDVFEALWNEDMQLWVGRRGDAIICAWTTRIVTTARGAIAVIQHCGGEYMDAFGDYVPRLKEWARANGATHLRLIGRDGWRRLLKRHFEKSYAVLESEL